MVCKGRSSASSYFARDLKERGALAMTIQRNYLLQLAENECACQHQPSTRNAASSHQGALTLQQYTSLLFLVLRWLKGGNDSLQDW
jgi:hypothetical protein